MLIKYQFYLYFLKTSFLILFLILFKNIFNNINSIITKISFIKNDFIII